MATTNGTVVQLSDRDKELLGEVAASHRYASGGYISGGPLYREPTRQEKTLKEILEVLKEIRDAYDRGDPAPPPVQVPSPVPMPQHPGQWYPWQVPYQHSPVWCATPPTDPDLVTTTWNV